MAGSWPRLAPVQRPPSHLCTWRYDARGWLSSYAGCSSVAHIVARGPHVMRRPDSRSLCRRPDSQVANAARCTELPVSSESTAAPLSL